MEKISNKCEHCHDEYYHSKSQKSKYCSSNCRQKACIQRSLKGTVNIDYVICKICNFKFKEINGDHLCVHNITKEEYDIKYGCRISEKTRLNKDTLSKMLTVELSKKLSDSHKLESYINKFGDKDGRIKYKKMINNKTYQNSSKSYTDEYGEELGMIKFKEVQAKKSMTLENQIILYGIEDGTTKYNNWLVKQKNKNTISYYINLYGYDNGLSRWFKKNNKISMSNSKIDKKLRTEFKKYCMMVEKYTRLSLQLFDLKNIELRGLSNGYDLDHKISKIYGFKNNISPETIGHISNLEIITSKENRKKQHNSNLDINYVLECFNSDKKYLKIISKDKDLF